MDKTDTESVYHVEDIEKCISVRDSCKDEGLDDLAERLDSVVRLMCHKTEGIEYGGGISWE